MLPIKSAAGLLIFFARPGAGALKTSTGGANKAFVF